MIGSSHSQLCKKHSCSVKLKGWPLDYNPRKIPIEDSWIIILQNNSKCLLLNDKQMPHEILFGLLEEIQTQKNEQTKIERKEIWKKSKRNRVSYTNIYIALFAFLSSTAEESRWSKLNEMFVFGILFIYYVWLLRLLWNEVFENNKITFNWQLFGVFLSNIKQMLLLNISHRYDPTIFIKNLKEVLLFHLKNFSSLLCSTLSPSSLLNRQLNNVSFVVLNPLKSKFKICLLWQL